MKYLDGCDKIAQMIGSCNTIKIENGKWIGYNTDGIGALRSLREESGHNLAGLKFVSFGAGGAARSICFELAAAGAAKIVLSDINQSCYQLAAEINTYFPNLAEGISADDAALEAKVREADMLLNNSGLGMQPYLNETPIPQNWLMQHHICFDAIYNPAQTRFLLEAEQKGCRIINGLGMLIYQAAAQIEIWTGLKETEEYLFKVWRDMLMD
jgi:shikimate dehydrogenase